MQRGLRKILTIGTLSAVCSYALAAQVPTQAQIQEISDSLLKSGGTVFPIGEDNTAYAKYFTGQTFLAPLSAKGANVGVSNVTFAPTVINHWHTHQGSCQILVGVSGRGWYQIWGQQPQEIKPGVVVTIPENVKHWHGAASGSWFQHLSIMGAAAGTTWLEPVDQNEYKKLK